MRTISTITIFVFGIVLVFNRTDADKPCVGRRYNHSSIVCVCNSTYCDEISKITPLSKGKYVVYTSSLNGKRFEKSTGVISQTKLSFSYSGNDIMGWLRSFVESSTSLKINRQNTYQNIIGFGGSFTDATGYNILKLSNSTQEKFIRAYYSENGLEYNVGRVPIAGTDFSTHVYAYNMYPEGDKELSNFSLTTEDYDYKIPFIHRAKEISTNDLLLVGTAWSPPKWMKTNNEYGGISRLLPEYYQTWADYHLKFLQNYNENNISFWAITTGNEPSNGVVPLVFFNSLGWMPREQARWLADNLGPTIKNSEFSNVNILALDDQRFSLPWWIEWMSENTVAKDFIDGIATHWYWDEYISTNNVDETHSKFPDKFLISTEACVGDKPWQLEKVELGSWERAELYIKDIIEVLNHWYIGWIDWNLALDRIGGPNWINNFVDSPIIVMPDNDEFLKQPMFYIMGHFSKFIPRDSKRISVEVLSGGIENVAFLRPDNGITVILYNRRNQETEVILQENDKGFIKVTMPPKSIQSVVYW